MKITKILGVMAAAALALMAFASTASATTLDVEGTKQTGPVTIHATNETSVLLSATGGGFANTCTQSTVIGTTTTPFSATKIGGPIEKLTFEKCTEDAKEPVVVDEAGYLTVEWIKGTNNGTVYSDNAKVTSPSPFGKLTCTTAATGTDIGTLTAATTNTSLATMDINGVLNCGFFLPSAKWEGKYTVTSPLGLKVTE